MSLATNKMDISGVLLLDKPSGITSNAALQKVKRLFTARRAGHTGSLDPLASGMLPLCLGEATKFSQFLLEADKRYQVTARLGIKTTTGDAEGEIIQQAPVPSLNSNDWSALLSQFTGEIEQIPSMYSALKYNGQPLYKLARQGIEVERQSRRVHVYRIQLLAVGDDYCRLEVHCSKGTYIRTLVEDIGEQLGCGAHAQDLRRLTVAHYGSEQMITLAALEQQFEQQGRMSLIKLLLPLDSLLPAWQEVALSEATAFYVRRGQPVLVPNAPTQGWVRLTLKHSGHLVGVGEILQDGRVAPRRLVGEAGAQQRAKNVM